MLYVGQKVVCVNVWRWPRYPDPVTLPTEGAVYTIRATLTAAPLATTRTASCSRKSSTPCAPAMRRPARYHGELCFRVSRFRPLHDSNIDIFTQMLEPVPQEPAELVEA